MSPEFIRLLALVTLRSARDPRRLSLAIRAASIAARLNNPAQREYHLSRCLFLIKLHGGAL